MGRTSHPSVTFRCGRRISFSSALIDGAKLKPGQCFSVTIVQGPKNFVRLIEAPKQNETDYYIFLARMNIGCNKAGNEYVGITDQDLSNQLKLDRMTHVCPAKYYQRDGRTVVEFAYPTKETK